MTSLIYRDCKFMKKKTLKIILIGVMLYITLVVIELCCVYAALGDNIWDFLKDNWEWYKTLF